MEFAVIFLRTLKIAEYKRPIFFYSKWSLCCPLGCTSASAAYGARTTSADLRSCPHMTELQLHQHSQQVFSDPYNFYLSTSSPFQVDICECVSSI
jgi:hypothetical protein